MIIASIDIGTNTVLLLIARADPETKIISPLLNEYRMPRLGSGLIPGSEIKSDRIEYLFHILEEYENIIAKNNADKVLVTATNAFRIAKNASSIVNEIKEKFKWNVDVINGDCEAEFAYLGAVSFGADDKPNLVIDIGGGSTEVIIGTEENIIYKKSFHIGSVSSTELYLKNRPPSLKQIDSLNSFLNNTFAELQNISAPTRAIAISGTPTTIACMIKGKKEYNDDLVEGSYLKADHLHILIGRISNLTPAEIKHEFGKVMNGREDIILGGSLILLKIMELAKIEEVIVSTRGIRYGAIVSYLIQDKS
jgi:exopolyphosphatase/guanosine-5'-triphosphate,3'-diphosphate pyrophosphatase